MWGKSVWASRLPRLPLRELSLITSAPSLEMFPSEDVSIVFMGFPFIKSCKMKHFSWFHPGILRGTVVSAGKMKRTVIVRRNYLHYIPKYKRYEKRHTNIAVHCSPALDAREGDTVTIGECRYILLPIQHHHSHLSHKPSQIYSSSLRPFTTALKSNLRWAMSVKTDSKCTPQTFMASCKLLES